MNGIQSKIATLKNSNDVSEIDDSTLNLGLLSYPVLQAADIMLYKWVTRWFKPSSLTPSPELHMYLSEKTSNNILN